MKKAVISFFICSLIVLNGCTSHQQSMEGMDAVVAEKPDDILWRWQSRAVTLHVSAVDKLNNYQGKAHSLMICMYQLSTLADMNALRTDIEGRDTLLECKSFSSSVKDARRLFFQPGEHVTRFYDRYDGVRFIVFVAGYNYSDADKTVAVYPFPVEHKSRGYLFWSKKEYLPGKLKLNLKLDEASFFTENQAIKHR